MTPPASPIRLGSIDELRFSAVLADLDGVVYRGDEAIPGAVDRLRSWRERGVPYCFVTNNAEKSAEQFAEKLMRLGVPCTPNEVVTSADIAIAHLEAHYAAGTGVFCVGSASLRERVEAHGFELSADEAKVVLVGLDREFSYDKMAIAVRRVLAGASLVATNADLLRPIHGTFEPGAGAILQSIAASAGVTPRSLGKPSPEIAHVALARIGARLEDSILIGDQLETDILTARTAGIRSVLVETGVPAKHGSHIVPDYVLASL
ncbi:HAD-IIA family hydrolase [Devosia albogilva]|uniref:HAD-IIA family hydrolase n=1 Tax=Devosia albogilva TaxID=429726 RepID=A0ABW5QI52_9HYPH